MRWFSSALRCPDQTSWVETAEAAAETHAVETADALETASAAESTKTTVALETGLEAAENLL